MVDHKRRCPQRGDTADRVSVPAKVPINGHTRDTAGITTTRTSASPLGGVTTAQRVGEYDAQPGVARPKGASLHWAYTDDKQRTRV